MLRINIVKAARKPIAVYVATALLVMGPMLLPGYILTLDMTFTPQLDAPNTVDSTYLFRWLLHLLDLVLPAQIIQKLMLLAVLVLSGFGMHRLVGWLADRQVHIEPWAVYAAGLFYMSNPFIYTRFMVGHYFILLGYALLPFFVLSLARLLNAPGRRQAVVVGLWAAACASVNIHIIYPLLIISLVLLGAHLLYASSRRQFIRSLLAPLGVAAAVWLLLCGFWLLPSLLGSSSTSTFIATFDERHILAFATRGDPAYGLGFNVAGLHGFWADNDLRYLLPKVHAPLWPVLTVFVVSLSLLGAVVGIRKKQPLVAGLAVIGIIGWLLSMGTRGFGGGLYRFMLDTLPLFGGYREPQKFMVLLVLAYAVLLAVGASWLYRRWRWQWLQTALMVAVLALPFLYTPTMFWGFSGQLRPVDYPPDWHALNEKFQRERSNFKVLFLPWHMYLTLDFHDRVIANPAARFFDVPVIIGDNAEIGNLDTEGATAETRYIREAFLKSGADIANAGKVLTEINVKYIVLAKNHEHKQYDYLNDQPSLRLIQNGEHLKVYENLNYQ